MFHVVQEMAEKMGTFEEYEFRFVQGEHPWRTCMGSVLKHEAKSQGGVIWNMSNSYLNPLSEKKPLVE